jgi:ubiquinone/menaquinone biosynthesis C-methylase UbiE
MTSRVDYGQIASNFDHRYTTGRYENIRIALRAFVTSSRPGYTLEVGCGTGYWLYDLRELVPHVYGLDYSFEMLEKAQGRGLPGKVVRATAEAIPFHDATFDLIFCINAIHHFERFEYFIGEARCLLRPGGNLAVLGMDPHHGRDNWCIYDYFPETKPTDLARYPSSGQITDAMIRAGFDRVECDVVCRWSHALVGEAVLQDPELQRRGCSQMALLSDEQYAQGIKRIRSALENSKRDAPTVFKADIAMMMRCGHIDR